MTAQPERRLTPLELANQAREDRARIKAEDMVWLIVVAGEDPERAAKRVGTSLDATEKTLRRMGRREDWYKILAARPLPVHHQPAPNRRTRT